jgi:hypothetical protein
LQNVTGSQGRTVEKQQILSVGLAEMALNEKSSKNPQIWNLISIGTSSPESALKSFDQPYGLYHGAVAAWGGDIRRVRAGAPRGRAWNFRVWWCHKAMAAQHLQAAGYDGYDGYDGYAGSTNTNII